MNKRDLQLFHGTMHCVLTLFTLQASASSKDINNGDRLLAAGFVEISECINWYICKVLDELPSQQTEDLSRKGLYNRHIQNSILHTYQKM